jgi:hypothetical protein
MLSGNPSILFYGVLLDSCKLLCYVDVHSLFIHSHRCGDLGCDTWPYKQCCNE